MTLPALPAWFAPAVLGLALAMMVGVQLFRRGDGRATAQRWWLTSEVAGLNLGQTLFWVRFPHPLSDVLLVLSTIIIVGSAIMLIRTLSTTPGHRRAHRQPSRG